MSFTVDDLKDQTTTPGPHPVLYCEACGGTYSANAGDYFDRKSGVPFLCCEEPMRLVYVRTVYEDVKPPASILRITDVRLLELSELLTKLLQKPQPAVSAWVAIVNETLRELAKYAPEE